MPRRKRRKLFLNELPQNIFSGFVVSLVALPLGLGLALASGAPPISGLIAAIVGGLVVSLLGGSYVTISGPGNGLVVAVLGAITVLADGDMYQGYLYTLAAIVISGLIIWVLAFFNLGKVANFFPASAIQGLLAAIGIIILSKQFHIMVGNMNAQGSPIELLLAIPKSVLMGITDPQLRSAAIAGVISLVIMALYPKIRNRYFQFVPAPMWIVLISVGVAYFFNSKYSVMSHPIPDRFFVSIPDDLFSKYISPDFGKLDTFPFWGAVFTITLIASIESLLSIKAVDKLDPKKRRADVKRDLKAIGVATVISGMLGGLNVVTVIARSSVNINNKATNRSANFFQGLFLIAFVVLLKDQLEHIPFPALAAILVYTGYKLASPAIVERISEVGQEQVFIFVVTLLATLTSGLISGIIVGVIITFMVHLYLTKSFKLFFSNLTTNNVDSFYEPDGKLHVTVKYFSSFVNFFRLKKILDQADGTANVVLDFLPCRFVDHTVMESLWDYELMFDKNGGSFEVIGLDLHNAESDHPSALRRALEYVHFVPEQNTMTKRQKEIAKYCEDIDWVFEYKNDYHIYFLNGFNYFKNKVVDHLYNIGKDTKETFMLFDIEYKEGTFIAEEELHASMVFINTGVDIPAFTLNKANFYERMKVLNQFSEIRLKSFRDFADRFSLRGSGDKIRPIRRFFDEDIILFFESNPYYHIESNGYGGILIMDKERLNGVGELKAKVDFAKRLQEVIAHKKENYGIV